MPRFSILIPSRLEGPRPGTLFLETATASIHAQKLPTAPQILVGIDADVLPPPNLAKQLGITFVNSGGSTQAEALNAAATQMEGDHVAILEDDDEWNPDFLSIATRALQQFDFVSSTQLEVASGEVVRINDFPTPSGWVMRREVWDRVGGFNPAYRWHLDNEWLWRLAQTGARWAHLAEATAPVDLNVARNLRPQLADVLSHASCVNLIRHNSPWPLVIRTVHSESGTQRIRRISSLGLESREEEERLKILFGRQHGP